MALKGQIIAVTSGLCESSDPDVSDNEEASGNGEDAGATTVHKRVTMVITSQAAVDRNTQKVRKARKLGITLVDARYLLDCKSANKKLSLDDYVISDNEAKQDNKTDDEHDDEKDD